MEATRYKLTVAYDGANYQGWQWQKIGTGVQELVEKSLKSIFQEDLRIHGSSRTDTGVHARAMIAHVDIPSAKMPFGVEKLLLAINANLPEDIRVMEARKVDSNFHARFDAKGKQYRYFIYNFPALDPLFRRTSWHVPKALDRKAMTEASQHFLGKLDFAAFAANRNYKMESTVRTLTRCDLRKSGPLYTVIIEGDGFLYKMCRGIVGTVVQVGLGKFEARSIPKILESKDRAMSGMSAPAHGLVLWKVFY